MDQSYPQADFDLIDDTFVWHHQNSSQQMYM